MAEIICVAERRTYLYRYQLSFFRLESKFSLAWTKYDKISFS